MRTFLHIARTGENKTIIVALEDVSTIVGPYEHSEEEFFILTLSNKEAISISPYQYTVVAKALEKKYGVTYC